MRILGKQVAKELQARAELTGTMTMSGKLRWHLRILTRVMSMSVGLMGSQLTGIELTSNNRDAGYMELGQKQEKVEELKVEVG